MQKHIYLIGICGTAMASLAGMLKVRGLDVRGSDIAAYPPMSTFLDSLSIPVSSVRLLPSLLWGGVGGRAIADE